MDENFDQSSQRGLFMTPRKQWNLQKKALVRIINVPKHKGLKTDENLDFLLKKQAICMQH
jgi:hypothetical protein